MAGEYGDVYKSPETFTPEGPPPKAGRGCFFYGCLFSALLSVVAVVGIALVGFFGYRFAMKLVEDNTSTTPKTLPKVQMTEEQRKTLDDRVAAFKKALDDGEDAEPLVLTADELNAVVAEHGKTEGRVYFSIEGEKLNGEVSLPLDELGFKGRFFNGKATFRAALEAGRLVVFADSLEVNGRPLPDQFMAGLRNENLAKDVAKDPKNAAVLEKLKTIVIKDGKIVITAKPKDERPSKAPEPPKADGEPAKDA
ncbi:hypothetical protein ACYOEI_32625, partial [Singulisphaera rosea]